MCPESCCNFVDCKGNVCKHVASFLLSIHDNQALFTFLQKLNYSLSDLIFDISAGGSKIFPACCSESLFNVCGFCQEVFLALELFMIYNSCIECGFQGIEYPFSVVRVTCMHFNLNYWDFRVCLENSFMHFFSNDHAGTSSDNSDDFGIEKFDGPFY